MSQLVSEGRADGGQNSAPFCAWVVLGYRGDFGLDGFFDPFDEWINHFWGRQSSI